MVRVVLGVNVLGIAYAAQQNGIKYFGMSKEEWSRLFRGPPYRNEKSLITKIRKDLEKERVAAKELMKVVESEWRPRAKHVLVWLRELTRVDFVAPTVKVWVVPFSAGETPFREMPVIIVGKLRKGWGYPETIAHELAHILFNQNFKFENDMEHPYVQLIEEEIAIRLGARSKYFDYEIPSFAGWVQEAQQKEKAWKHYLKHTKEFKDISRFIEWNERRTQ